MPEGFRSFVVLLGLAFLYEKESTCLTIDGDDRERFSR